MFNLVAQLLLEDQQRSDKVVTYAQTNTMPIWGALTQLYSIATKDYTPEQLEDLSNGIIIADEIYNSLP